MFSNREASLFELNVAFKALINYCCLTFQVRASGDAKVKKEKENGFSR